MAGLTTLRRAGLEAVAVSTLARWLSVGELGVGEKRLGDGIVGKAPNVRRASIITRKSAA